jgi:hypothetical protein
MSRKDQLLRIMAALDGHFAADDCTPADADRWRELKRHIVRMRDALDLARIGAHRAAHLWRGDIELEGQGKARSQGRCGYLLES